MIHFPCNLLENAKYKGWVTNLLLVLVRVFTTIGGFIVYRIIDMLKSCWHISKAKGVPDDSIWEILQINTHDKDEKLSLTAFQY